MMVTTIPVGMLGTNCYLIESGADCAVVDPGAQPDKIIAQIEDLGLVLKYILLTHGHYDHIGGVKKLMSVFPDAVLYIGENDLEMLGDSQKSLAVFRQDDDSDFVIGNAKTLKEGDAFSLGELTISVLDTPGHTKGSISYLCEEVLFSGDTLFFENVGRTDLYGGDFSALKNSLSKLAALKDEYFVYPGHGDPTSLEHERQYNPYMTSERP